MDGSSYLYATATQQPCPRSRFLSHGRGPRFGPLCVHHFHIKINDLTVCLPAVCPRKAGAQYGHIERTGFAKIAPPPGPTPSVCLLRASGPRSSKTASTNCAQRMAPTLVIRSREANHPGADRRRARHCRACFRMSMPSSLISTDDARGLRATEATRAKPLVYSPETPALVRQPMRYDFFLSGAMAPSCCISEKRFATPQCSVILPLCTRMASTVSKSIFRPVGATPRNSPLCVP